MTDRLRRLRRRLVLRLAPRRIKLERDLARWFFNRRALAKITRREHVLCLGDSHAGILRQVRLPGAWLQVTCVEGATASGILNEHSATKARRRFLARLGKAKAWQRVLVQLGEVDCGSVIWHRAQRQGLSLDGQLNCTLDAYETFLREIDGRGFTVMVLSAPLPTIDVPSAWKGLSKLRMSVSASIVERTELTLRYNDELRKRCERLGVCFVDVTTQQLDPVTGVIERRFVRPVKRDHHLVDEPYRELIARELNACRPAA